MMVANTHSCTDGLLVLKHAFSGWAGCRCVGQGSSWWHGLVWVVQRPLRMWL